MEYCSHDQVKALCEEFGFHFTKSLGQNFLVNPDTVRRIAEASGADRDTAVLEVGPGFGALTAALAERAGHVYALELDRSLFPVLDKTLADYSNVTLIQGDVLKADLAAPFADDAHPRRIVAANLPYYITTKTILRLLGTRMFDRLTVMIQKEAADKLLCRPGTENWCLFSLLAHHYADVELCFPVPRSSFRPQPTVDSSVIRMTPRKPLDDAAEPVFLRLADGVFAMRRKNLVNCLRPVFGQEIAESATEICAIDPARRGESLTLAEAEALAECVSRLQSKKV